MYINTETQQYPITQADIRALFPNTSFPANFVPPAPFAFVNYTMPPAHNQLTETVREVVPVPTEGAACYEQAWEIVPLPSEQIAINMAAAQARKWEAIKAKRDRLSDVGGYKVGTKWFHSDNKSKVQQLGLVVMGANVPPVQWKTMDGSFVTMTQQLAAQIFAQAAAQDMAIFATAEMHKAAMLASENPEDYDFSTGWPETFVA
jgi:hypothetical protein